MRITSVGLEFALPALAGAGLDRWLGTRPIGVIGGAVLGFCVGMYHLLQIAALSSGPPELPGRRPPGRN